MFPASLMCYLELLDIIEDYEHDSMSSLVVNNVTIYEKVLVVKFLSGSHFQGIRFASVTSGVHSGLQFMIEEMVSFPVPFVHCGCYNLNLNINDAVDTVDKDFFGLLRDISSLFGQSLNRWGGAESLSRPKFSNIKVTVRNRMVF